MSADAKIPKIGFILTSEAQIANRVPPRTYLKAQGGSPAMGMSGRPGRFRPAKISAARSG
jgi:hypothetical protein